MHILTVTDVYFPRINGVSTSIRTLHGALTRAGHDITMIAPAYPVTSADASLTIAPSQPRERILRVDGWRVPFDPEDRLMSARAVRDLMPTLHREAFDVIHVHTPFVAHRTGLELASAFGRPLVETYHTHFEAYLGHYIPLVPRPWLRSLARRLARRQCNRVDTVVVPSTAMKDTLRDYGVDAPIEKIPTGLALDELTGGDGTTFRRRHSIPAERPVLLFVGRAAHEKNIDFLLHMTQRVREQIPDVLLVVTGEGPAMPHLLRLTRRLGLESNVQFIGYLSRKDALLDAFKGSDLFVFASRTETQGLVLLEAMACGLPVVSTAILGTADILRDGQGAVVAPDDLDGFTTCVTRLLGDPLARRRLAREAPQEAARWGDECMAERMLTLYRDVRDQHSAVPRRGAA